MSSDIPVIQIQNLSKNYLLFNRPEDRLKQMIVPKLQRMALLKPNRYYDEYAAVNNVSFDVFRGQTVGIIGKNGSGKSTLLQMICGTLTPSLGNVSVNGRIAALLELGAGFNPDFSGRENVYLNAAILGLSKKETDARFGSIERFADIGVFIDQPVKTYSSGMYIRLAFAVAINVDPDILVVDEALAVGDEAFQRKCFARIEQIKKMGATILFVSHSAQSIVQLCDRAVFLDRGELLLQGEPKEVIGQYQKFSNLTGEQASKYREEIKALDLEVETEIDIKSSQSIVAEKAASSESEDTFKEKDESWYDESLISKSAITYDMKHGEISDYDLFNVSGCRVNNLYTGYEYSLEFDVNFKSQAKNIICGMLIKALNGVELCGVNTQKKTKERIEVAQQNETHRIKISFTNNLTAGTYLLNMGVMGQIGDDYIFVHRILDAVMFKVHEAKPSLSSGFFDLSGKIEQSLKVIT